MNKIEQTIKERKLKTATYNSIYDIDIEDMLSYKRILFFNTKNESDRLRGIKNKDNLIVLIDGHERLSNILNYTLILLQKHEIDYICSKTNSTIDIAR